MSAQSTESSASSEGKAPRKPYEGFGGKVGRTRAVSEPWWEPKAEPPHGSPNVVVMLMDDLGFSDFGCFGAEVETPNIDRIAHEGIRFGNFHVTPLCSPSRAALLTGLNHHRAGIGQVIEGTGDTGFPGYRGELAADVLTMGEVFRANGYATLAVGKWHVTNQMTEGGSKSGWPLQRGFDRYYGFLSNTDYWNPPLVEDNHYLDIEEHPEGYYLTDDLVDNAVKMFRASKGSDPDRPVLMYFAQAAVHAPFHAKASDLEKYKDRYHEGWDVLRQRRYERQLALGVIPADTVLPPRNTELGHAFQPWEDLSDREKELFARYMALYAAMIDSVDQSVGKLRAAFEELGEWDNTIFLLLSDNGASRTSGENGTSNFFRTVTNTLPGAGSLADNFELDYSLLSVMGGPQTYPGYPHGWAAVSNTPYRLYKMNTHAGGHQVPLIMSWKNGELAAVGGVRRQYVHVIDVLPTLVDLLGLAVPDERNGLPRQAFQGVTIGPVLLDDNAPSPRTEQYYEMWGNRGFFKDDEEVVTLHQRGTAFGDDTWELYDLLQDPTELNNLADGRPERVIELTNAWDRVAWDNQVFPLDERIGLNQIRPDGEREPRRVTLLPTMPRFRGANGLMTRRSFTIDVDVTWEDGDAGVLVAYGGQAGGFVLYIEGGFVHLKYNFYGRLLELSGGRLTPGRQTIGLESVAAAGGVWTFTVYVDGEPVGSGPDWPMVSGQGGSSGLDVGLNRCSPVDWDLWQRHGTFRYSGVLHKVVLEPGAPAPDRGPEYFARLRQEALSLQ
jgi:arylsulfatase A-like enzyme